LQLLIEEKTRNGIFSTLRTAAKLAPLGILTGIRSNKQPSDKDHILLKDGFDPKAAGHVRPARPWGESTSSAFEWRYLENAAGASVRLSFAWSPSISLGFFFGNRGWWHARYFGGGFHYVGGVRVYDHVRMNAIYHQPGGHFMAAISSHHANMAVTMGAPTAVETVDIHIKAPKQGC
jgi:hypothetical protein